ncbi:MAG: FAD-dependent oxidoreductase [Xanthomonadales bacterium]|nr:FAD-dependent oxidoreductase [Xanthomonadales bacterium]
MRHDYNHLIIGAGMAGEAAAKAIHEAAPDARIGMLGAELHPPYARPPLSKALWKDAMEEDIWLPLDAHTISLHAGRRAVQIDADAHVIHDDRGDQYHYGKLLLATGCEPRRLPFDGDRVLAYRTLEDYRCLRRHAVEGAHIAVVGGGFIGCEIAAALAINGCTVKMIYPEERLGARVYPQALSDFIGHYYGEHGIELRAGCKVVSGEQVGDRVNLILDEGSRLEVDAVVAGMGVVPEVALAQAVGARVDNGVLVDECFRTSVPDIFAAGDIASFPNQALGRRIRVEHEDAALSSGRVAGRAMAGRPEPYAQLPFFYSDLFDLGYEAVGVLDNRLELVEDWITPNREGVVYYCEAGRVRGVLLWNVWGQVDAARALIAEPSTHTAASLRGRIRG